MPRVIRRAPAPASSYEDEEPRRRSRRDLEEEDDAPRSRFRPVTGVSKAAGSKSKRGDEGLITSGWGGKKQLLSDMPSDFAPNFALSEDKTVIKFLEDGPVANFRQHWAEWLPSGSRLSYVCRKVDCPICEIGDRPSARICFNILDFTDPEAPVVKILGVGAKVSNLIESFTKERATTPLSRPDIYYVIWKTTDKKGGSGRRSGGTTQTNLKDVKARDLYEDYEVEPLDADDLEAFQLYTAEQIIQPSSMRELEEVAEAYTG